MAISYIDIVRLPNKLSYNQYEPIDITGIEVHGYDENGNDLGEIPYEKLTHTGYADVRTDITSFYLKNTINPINPSGVYAAGTLISTNDGDRSPITKAHDGSARFIIGYNACGDDLGGNWILYESISDSADAARFMNNSTSNHVYEGVYRINNINYYFCTLSTNAVEGGATTATNPLDLPTTHDIQWGRPNSIPTMQQIKQLIRYLKIELIGDVVTVGVRDEESWYGNSAFTVQYGIHVSPINPGGGGGGLAYVGVNNLAKNISNMYIGVNGVAKKITKGYVGVNGIAKQFWGGGSSSKILKTWDYWTSLPTGISTEGQSFVKFGEYGNHNCYFKLNNRIAYYAVFRHEHTHEGTTYRYLYPMLMSTDPNAVVMGIWGTMTYSYIGTITDINGIVWYYSYAYAHGGSINDRVYTPYYFGSSGMFIQNRDIILNPDGYYHSIDEAAQALLDRIYDVPFLENYQVGQTYNIIPAYQDGDDLKLIRKAIGIQLALAFNNNINNTSYEIYSNSINYTIIQIMNIIKRHGFQKSPIGISLYINEFYDLWWDPIQVFFGWYESNIGAGLPVNYLDRYVKIQHKLKPGDLDPLESPYYRFPQAFDNYRVSYDDYYYEDAEDYGRFVLAAYPAGIDDDNKVIIMDEEFNWSFQASLTAFIGIHGSYQGGLMEISNLGLVVA